MTSQNANPSLNPANNGSLTGMLNVVFSKMMQNIDGVLPARVIAYNGYPDNVAQVQPVIKVLTTNNQQISRGQIAQVPVCQIGAGGYALRFNLKPGDLGLILACDRDISLFVRRWQDSPPNTNRIKSFSDALFLPLVFSNMTVNDEEEENATLQSLDGAIRISLFQDKVKITGDVEIDGSLTVNNRLICDEDIASGGNITAAGDITPNTPIPP